jgi:hypothetical protein
MPAARASADPDCYCGDGIFRGRYATARAAHAAGEPVVLFPFRYWDRWADGADEPELAYFGLELEQPGAHWTRFFWTTEDTGLAGASLGLLLRSDARVPWNADPDETDGLDRFDEGPPPGGAFELGVRADRLEWRVYARYSPGAFDLLGDAHGWKAAPLLGAECYAPGRTYARIER